MLTGFSVKSQKRVPKAEQQTTTLFTTGPTSTKTGGGWRLWASFAVGVLLALVSGSLYGYAAFQTDLKNSMSLNQEEMEAMGVSMHLGLYLLKPLAGMFYDWTGPRLTAVLAAAFGAGGYFLVSQICGKAHSKATLVLGITGFTFVGIGSGLGYISALTTSARNFKPEDRGKIMGTISSGFGLSATLVSLTYIHAVASLSADSRLPYFFIILAVCVGVVGLLAAIFVTRVAQADTSTISPSPVDERLATEDMSVNLVDNHVAWTQRSVSLLQTTKHLMRDVWFWKLYVLFAIGTGCGLLVINNVGTLRQSLAGHVSHSAVQTLVISLAIASCLGRLVVGWVSDAVHIRRHHFFVLSLALISLTLFTSLAVPYGSPNLIEFTVIGVGFGYGGIWASVSTIISEHYGLANFGKVYGLYCTAPALSSFVFNEMASLMYESHLQGDSEDCYGQVCYAGSMAIAASLCMLAAVGAVFL